MAVERPDRVVSSPLRRARETAEAFGLPVEIDERWIELDYGELDGMPVESVGAEVWKQWRSDLRFTPPGGESILVDERPRAAGLRGPGRRGRASATSSSSATCRRSRPR